MNSITIPFEEDDAFGNDDYYVTFKFKIEDLEEDCPTLYARWQQDNQEAKIDRSVETAFERFLVAMAEKIWTLSSPDKSGSSLRFDWTNSFEF